MTDNREKDIGRYVMQRTLIGKGSFASVFKGYRKGDHETVAIKVIKRNNLNDKLMGNLACEIQTLRKINHPHVVRLFDVKASDNYYYLIMEFCHGDLSEYMKKVGSMANKVARRFLRQLAKGMHRLREMNLVHRDLKPQNILLTSKDPKRAKIKIADFGFAKVIPPNDLTQTMCGSPLYMAPEVLNGRKYNEKVDLWSIGVVLYQMLTGKLPFPAKNLILLVKKIETGVVDYPEYLEEDARDLLVRLLQVDPKKRISFREFFVHPYVDLSSQQQHRKKRKVRSKKKNNNRSTSSSTTQKNLNNRFPSNNNNNNNNTTKFQQTLDEKRKAKKRAKLEDYFGIKQQQEEHDHEHPHEILHDIEEEDDEEEEEEEGEVVVEEESEVKGRETSSMRKSILVDAQTQVSPIKGGKKSSSSSRRRKRRRKKRMTNPYNDEKEFGFDSYDFLNDGEEFQKPPVVDYNDKHTLDDLVLIGNLTESGNIKYTRHFFSFEPVKKKTKKKRRRRKSNNNGKKKRVSGNTMFFFEEEQTPANIMEKEEEEEDVYEEAEDYIEEEELDRINNQRNNVISNRNEEMSPQRNNHPSNRNLREGGPVASIPTTRRRRRESPELERLRKIDSKCRRAWAIGESAFIKCSAREDLSYEDFLGSLLLYTKALYLLYVTFWNTKTHHQQEQKLEEERRRKQRQRNEYSNTVIDDGDDNNNNAMMMRYHTSSDEDGGGEKEKRRMMKAFYEKKIEQYMEWVKRRYFEFLDRTEQLKEILMLETGQQLGGNNNNSNNNNQNNDHHHRYFQGVGHKTVLVAEHMLYQYAVKIVRDATVNDYILSSKRARECENCVAMYERAKYIFQYILFDSVLNISANDKNILIQYIQQFEKIIDEFDNK